MREPIPPLIPVETPHGWVLRGPDGRDVVNIGRDGVIRWTPSAVAQHYLTRECALDAIGRLGRPGAYLGLE